MNILYVHHAIYSLYIDKANWGKHNDFSSCEKCSICNFIDILFYKLNTLQHNTTQHNTVHFVS